MASTSAAFPTKGSLKRTSFAKLMRGIGKAKATGSLYLLNGDTKKVVFFSEGRPTFVRSNVLEECLGQILALEGLITQQQCDQTLEAIRRTGKKQGELLVEMGILSAGNLRYGLESQLRRKLFDIFTWGDGRFQFKPGQPKQDLGLDLATTTAGLITAALLERDDLDAAKKGLELFGDRYVKAKLRRTDELNLQPKARYWFTCLDGSKTARELVDAATDESEASWRTLLLFALVSAGAVELPKEAQPEQEPPAPPADDSERPDEDFKADHEPASKLKPFEDTPLPGELPVRGAELSGADADIDEAFANVASEDSGSLVSMESVRVHNTDLVDRALLDADPDALDEENFDEEIEVIEDAELELIEELDELDELVDDGSMTDGAIDGVDLAVDADLVLDGEDAEMLSLDELDDVALDAADLALEDDGGDPEMLGAMRYSEGEAALSAGQWAEAQGALEAAYEYGVDIAELHAMLAYARFKSDETSPEMAEHALELLDYASSMNANLDMIYAFRGDVLLARGDHNGARDAAQQALRLNEYNDIALSLMDRLG